MVNNMDSSEILELVKDGTIEPDEVEAFEGLDDLPDRGRLFLGRVGDRRK